MSLVIESRPTVQSIVAELWSKIQAAAPEFDIPTPDTYEGAVYCIELLIDWLPRTEARWFHFGHLYREAQAALVAIEDLAPFEPVSTDHGPKVCICHVSNWASLGCPVHGLDVPDHLEEDRNHG